MIFYFSGTGNTAWVAHQLSRQLGDTHIIAVGQALCDKAFAYSLAPDERLGFVFPTYCWGPAPVMLEFMKHIAVSGLSGHTYCYMVTTCGDDVGRCADIFSKAVTEIGANLKAAFSVQMPNNYVCLHGFNVDPKPLSGEKLHAAPAKVEQVAHLIAESRIATDVVTGKWAWIKSRVIRPIFLHYAVTDKPFRTDAELCSHCGMCQCVCPMHNITLSDTDRLPHWHGRCAMCLGCLHHCPTNAINWGRATVSKGRYTHPSSR